MHPSAVRLLVTIGTIAYPLVFFFPVLRPNSWLRLGDSPSDLDHAIFEVVGLKAMDYPWSQNVGLGFPVGENFWKIPSHVTQGIQWLAMWLISRFVDPALTVNVWMFIGFVTTGLIAYFVCRELEVSRTLSITASILIQALPWMSVKSMHHTSFVFLSVPLLMILGILKLRVDRFIGLGLLISYQLCLAFFDPYWFVLGGFVLSLGLAIRWRVIREILRRATWKTRLGFSIGTLLGLIAVYVSLRWGLNAVNSGSDTRPPNFRGIFSDDEILKWTGSVRDYFVPSHGHFLYTDSSYISGESDRVFYGGLVVLALGLLAIVSEVTKWRNSKVRLLAIVSGFVFVLSVRSFPLGWFEVPSPVIFVSNLTPGIRVFARFSPIAQSLFCILAVWYVQQLIRHYDKARFRLVAVVLVGVSFMDLGPMAYRPIYREYAKYEEFRTFLHDFADQPVLIPDGSITPLELSMETLPAAVNSRLLNTYSNTWKTRLYPSAWTSTSLAEYLRAFGDILIVAVLDSTGKPFISGEIQDAIRFSTSLEDNDFEKLPPTVTLPTGQTLGLFRLRDGTAENVCDGCALGQWLLTPQALVEETFNYVPSINNPLWLTEDKFEIRPEVIPEIAPDRTTAFLVDLVVRTYWGAPTTTVEFVVDGTTSLVLIPQGGHVTRQLRVSPGETVSVRSSSCFSPMDVDPSSTNSQRYCLGISGFRVLVLRD